LVLLAVRFQHYGTVDSLDLTDLRAGWKRELPEDKFPARRGHSTTLWEEEDGFRRLIVFGGLNDELLNDTWVLCLNKMEWSEPALAGTRPPGMRGHIAGISSSGRLVIAGGQQYGHRANLLVFVLDLEHFFWATFTSSFTGVDPSYSYTLHSKCSGYMYVMSQSVKCL